MLFFGNPMSHTGTGVATVVANDGLRYKSKTSGSTFGASGSTMSCIKCGLHRPRTLLVTKRIAGRLYLACSPSCEDVRKELAR
jgi:hypothetical protein